jgi:glyoxylase-like metal-dependent hydrolase (beta-lactamase superfamily II)
VINTHIHPDHIGSNRIFKKAKLLLSRNELALSQETAGVVFSGKDLIAFIHNKFPGYRESFGEFESEQMKYFIRKFWSDENTGLNLDYYFIDENPELPAYLSLIPTPGHSSDHYSVMVQAGDHQILAAGDAVANRLVLRSETIDRSGIPHFDYTLFEQSLNRLKEHQGLIACGHDRIINSITHEPFKKRVFNHLDISRIFSENAGIESLSPQPR